MLMRDHGPQPRAARPRRCTCCRSSGSATPGAGSIRRRQARARRMAGDRHRDRARHAELGARSLYASERTGAALLRERDQRRAAVRPSAEGIALLQGWLSRVRRARRSRRGESRQRRAPRRPRTIASSVPAGEIASVRLRLTANALSRSVRATSTSRSNAPARGRRVLRRAAAAGMHDADARAGAAAGVRRHDLEQAVLSTTTCREWLDGDPAQPPPPDDREHGRNCGMATSEQRRHHLDAGQVGISVVCGLGPGVSLHSAGARRSRVRQGAARAAHARMVHAPERPDSRPTNGRSAM